MQRRSKGQRSAACGVRVREAASERARAMAHGSVQSGTVQVHFIFKRAFLCDAQRHADRQNFLPTTWVTDPFAVPQHHACSGGRIARPRALSTRRALTPALLTSGVPSSQRCPGAFSGTPPEPTRHPNPIQPPHPPPPLVAPTPTAPAHTLRSRAAAHAAPGSERLCRLAAEHMHETHLLLRRTCLGSGLGLGLGLGLGSGSGLR